MRNVNTQFRVVGFDDFLQLTELPFNAPAIESVSRVGSFGGEWWSTRNALEKVLLSLCPRTLNPGDAFTLSGDYGCSRHIQFEINSLYFIHHGIVPRVHRFVRDQKPEYEVLIEHDLYLDEQYPNCGILVRRGEVVAFADDLNCLADFGLPIVSIS